MGQLETERVQNELIKPADLKGDLHFHMAPEGKEVGEFTGSWDSEIEAAKMIDWISKHLPGLEYLVVTDHLERFGSDPARFNEDDKYGVEHSYDDLKLVAVQLAKIRNLAEHSNNLRVISGIETSIQKAGSIGATSRMLDMFDLVIASEHYYPKSKVEQAPDQLTERLILALKNPGVDILGHPGRHYADWQLLDWEKIAVTARALDKALEVNMTETAELGYGTNRLEPVKEPDVVKVLAESGVKISIGSDMHKFKPLEEQKPLPFGQVLGVHRLIRDLNKAGFKKSQILNTYNANELIGWAKGHDKKS